MAYNTKAMLTDVNGDLIPQYYDPVADDFFPLTQDLNNVLIQNDDGTAVPIKLTGSNVQLLNAVSAVGAGTNTAVGQYSDYSFEVWGTATSFTLQIQAVGPSGTARNLKIWDELNNKFVDGNNITTAGFYTVSLPSFTNLRANVSVISGGNVNVSGGMMQ
ncbi:hypothetical protein [Bacillus sp. 03113]|uniref:hypothetical protein n=1 Tax=Bacillus sp. 03113 TaxID=2578211 RepID=UPI00114334E1|nr:hypothetical protein [Bacillus sp. 03113]